MYDIYKAAICFNPLMVSDNTSYQSKLVALSHSIQSMGRTEAGTKFKKGIAGRVVASNMSKKYNSVKYSIHKAY